MSNGFDPDQDRHSVGPHLIPKCLHRLSADTNVATSKERVNGVLQAIQKWPTAFTQHWPSFSQMTSTWALMVKCWVPHPMLWVITIWSYKEFGSSLPNIQPKSEYFVWFDSLRPINNLSVLKGWVFLGWTSTNLGLMFLPKDTTQWHRWGSNPRPFCLKSSTLPLSHCAP